MGVVLEATCDCGYRAENLVLGVGMYGGPNLVLAVCAKCQTLRSMPDASVADGCRRCGAALTLVAFEYYDNEDGALNTEVPYPCPSCSKRSLMFGLSALWD